MISMDAGSGRCRFCGGPYTGLLSMTDEVYTVPDVVPVCDDCAPSILTLWLRPVCRGHVQILLLTYHRRVPAWDGPYDQDPERDIPRVRLLNLSSEADYRPGSPDEPLTNGDKLKGSDA